MDWLLGSRKVRTAIAGLILILITAWANGEQVDPEAVINAVALLASALMGSIAWEDAAQKRAVGEAMAEHIKQTGGLPDDQ